MAMKYQHSTNQKASRAQAQSDQLPPIAPRLPRSQSANDAASHVYGSSQYAYNNRDAQYYYNNPPTHGPPSHTVDPYGYHDAYGYHQYAAEQAPNDETAAYHQYHAQQAAMKHAQHQRSQHALPPIYDNAPYNPGYYNTQQQQTNIHRQQQQQQQQQQRQQQQQPPPPQQHHYDRNLYAPYNIKDNKKKDKKDKETIDSKDNDALPSGPTKLRHAATTGGYFNKHSSGVVDIITSGRNLRYELEEIQNRKNLKTKELFDKRKKLSAKSSEKSHATRQLEDTKKKWNIEREEIIKSYGGKIPQFIIESDKLRKDLENLSNRNSALQASLEVVSAHLQNELYQLQYQLKIENEISQQTHEHNIELERRVRELRIEKLELETELKTEQDKEIAIEKNIYNDKQYYKNDNNKFKKEYPPESTVIENLLQAQVEFYFSDYNLKRDKRLLSDVTKPPKKGFLKLINVMKLSRIRQLCSEIETLEEALRRSNILTLVREDIKQEEIIKVKDEIKDEKKEKEQRKYEIWVGRLNFEKPREKEFPFRRTVFIFGIPIDGSKEFLEIMLKPFGNVSKIQFDHSPDGIDRKIGIKFLNKPRVYTLYYYDNTNIVDNSPGPNRREMIFKTSYDIGSGGGSGTKDVKKEVITMIKCHKCGKDKSVSEGFYTTSQWSVIYCAQCAAQLAEDQLNIYYKERNITQFQHYPRHKWLGIPPSDISNRKTALVVFASQRQASKCAYVRTRIAYNGAFATHFHHYSKVKKEIVLSESNENNKDIKDIKDKENVNKNNINQKNKMGKNDNKNKYKQKDNKSQQQRRRQNNNNRKKGRGQRNNDRNIRGQRQYTQYVNYAQQQAAYYAGQQPPPQQQQQHMPNMKQPKIYRQSSAPTGR